MTAYLGSTRPVSSLHRRKTLSSSNSSPHRLNVMSRSPLTRLDNANDPRHGFWAYRKDKSSALGRHGRIAPAGVAPVVPPPPPPLRNRTQPQITYAQRAKQALKQAPAPTPVEPAAPPPRVLSPVPTPLVEAPSIVSSDVEQEDASLSSMDEESSDDDIEIITVAAPSPLPALAISTTMSELGSERTPTPSLSTSSSASSLELLTPRDASLSPPAVAKCRPSLPAPDEDSSTSTITISLPRSRSAPLLPEIPFASLADAPACDYSMYSHVTGSETWEEEGALSEVIMDIPPAPGARQSYTESQQYQASASAPAMPTYEHNTAAMSGYNAPVVHQHQHQQPQPQQQHHQQQVPQVYYLPVMQQYSAPGQEQQVVEQPQSQMALPMSGYVPYQAPQQGYVEMPSHAQMQPPQPQTQPFVPGPQPHQRQFNNQQHQRPTLNSRLSSGNARPFGHLPGYNGNGGGRGRGRGRGGGFGYGGRDGGQRRENDGGGFGNGNGNSHGAGPSPARERSGSGGTGGGVSLGASRGRRNSVREAQKA
ncbi:hypothetical protein EXIGLDRAFT_75487 [Exidia glandulosa HHB12029]|uniref:Uncharacterized protein n=1 Tax=Exidia glandulosa HHB12029 TaxID=1314781 RepID=A0A165HS68_EXIGL|nr:hypothetical protein EXIGLDRAFT_75487 [Exidia glandulosa HHB12029]